MTFSERLEQLLLQKKMSGRDLALAVGVTTGAVSGWRHGGFPTADKACEIAQIFGVTVEQLVHGDELHSAQNGRNITLGSKYFLVPILDQELSAGKGALLPDDDTPVGLISVPQSMSVYGKELAAVVVRGDSMEPTLRNGDMIICDSKGWDYAEGVYAIRLNGKGYVKRIQVADNQILIKSDNKLYDTITEPINSENIQIIGKVHYIVKHI